MTTSSVEGPAGLLGLDPDFHRDPYPHYAELRERPPVREPVYGVYLVSRYDDVLEVVRRPEVFSSVVAPAGPAADLSDVDPEIRARLEQAARQAGAVHTLVTADPPDHGRYRVLVNRFLSAHKATALEPIMRQLADGLVDGFVEDGRVELVAGFAGPFPLRVVTGLLGMDPGEEVLLRRWADDAAEVIGNPPAARDRAIRGVGKRSDSGFDDYFRQRIDQRRRSPRDGDIVSDLVYADFGEGTRLSDAEILSILGHFLVAGHETSTKMLTTAMWLLLTHPEAMEAVRREPQLIPDVVEEALRFEAPVQGMFRLARVDATVGGTAIPAGAMLMLLYGSANRDGQQFADPEQFDLRRSNARAHLAFGQGPHFCAGAPFARAEGRVGLETILRRLDDLTLDEPPALPPKRTESFILRGIEALHVRFSPATLRPTTEGALHP